MIDRPKRKLQRLSGYDYTKNGAYFVTICSENRKNLFGEISTNAPGIIVLSPLGLILQNSVNEIPSHHKEVRILEFVIMPNHVHLLLEIDPVDCLTGSTNLSSIILGLKSYVSKTAREIGFQGKIWQKSFHDHIIRDEKDLEAHSEYIITNVYHWREDEYYNFN